MGDSASISSDAVAIVGLSGRFPGDASSPDRLWQLVLCGRNALSEVPPNRYNIDAFYHPSAEHIGTQNARGGYFINDNLAAFDALFFRIPVQEAHAMDPNQRLMLELSYEALENAGLSIQNIAGSDTGCYMATALRDYAALRATDPHEYPKYEVNGSMGTAMIANRISWFFDLKGPSISLDTACSSSLVALHLAVRSIRSGETETALVGATNLILMPETSNHLSTLTFLSPDSKSKAFDASANGYARGEGVCVLVVKSLAAALKDGDCIRAVIRGTSVNHDGWTPGINLPSAAAQEGLIRLAYADAGLGFEDTGYFEAHGTGTAAGDPLETEAVGRVFASSRKLGRPLSIGSVKTNIGHLEGAAGLAGLIKALFMLERGQIPPNLWFESLNPKIHLEAWGLTIPTELTNWPTDGLRRVSVNSFGYGGTNAHCILDDAYHYLSSRGLTGRHSTNIAKPALPWFTPQSISTASLSPSAHSDSRTQTPAPSLSPSEINSNTSDASFDSPQLLVWSSHEQTGIKRIAANLQSYLSERRFEDRDKDRLKRLAYTLSNRRSRLSWTSFVLAYDVPSTTDRLTRPAEPVRIPCTAPSVAFIFTGQGAQWAGMGHELMAYQTYRNSLLEASSYLRSVGCEWNLLEELNSPRINEPQISQPACTVVQVALVDLLWEWGIKPAIVVGHSSGEIAAAYAQGAISRESAWLIAYQRGKVSSRIATSGELGMLAVALSEADANDYIQQVKADPRPVLACINSPMSVTLSGSNEGLTEVQNLIGSRAMNRRLRVKTAYHSPYMREVAQPYMEALDGIESQKEKVDQVNQAVMFSSVTGQWIDGESVRQPQYWVDNMVSPVKFLHALDEALSFASSTASPTVLLEIGPHGALERDIQRIISARSTLNSQDVSYTSILTRKQNAIETSLTAVGILFQRGCTIDIFKANSADSLDGKQSSHLVDLPPYPWNHSSQFWYETPRTRAYRQRKEPCHDLLGTLDESCTEIEPVWKNYLRISEIPWLRHNMLQEQPILPFSGMLSMILEAVRRTSDTSRCIVGYQFRDVFPGPPLVLEENERSSVETRLTISNMRAGSRSLTSYWKNFSLSSRNRMGTWTQHSTGLVSIKYARNDPSKSFANEERALNEWYRNEYEVVKEADLKESSVVEFYETFSELGMQWAEVYQSLSSLRCSSSLVQGSIETQDSASLMPENYESAYVAHPTTLEGAFQLLSACNSHSSDKMRVPKYIESIFVSSTVPSHPGTRLCGFSKINEKWADGVSSTVVISDETFTDTFLIFESVRTTKLELEVDTKEPGVTAKALTKLGAYPVWDLDIENTSAHVVKELLQKVSDGALNADYPTIRDLEWAAYILCKRTTDIFSAKDTEKMAPHHQIYYRWMTRQIELAKSKALPCQTEDWITADNDVESEVLSRAASTSLEGKMLLRILSSMDSILKGSIEPWELMSGDGLLENMYRSGLSDEKTAAVQCEIIKRLSHKRPLRILEVGAGTGTATSKILSQLDPAKVAKYTYTDISASFFSEAADEFKSWATRGIMDFKVFNAEQSPRDQGLELGAYDVVVAFQVLHATSRMDETLAHCRKLLRPGGYLIVTELTSKVARRSAVFGVLAGWWLGEQDGRLWGPEMLEEEWNLQLRRQGFSGVDWCFRDRDDEGWSSSVIASRALDLNSTGPATYKKVIIATTASLSDQAKAVLQEVSKGMSTSGVTVEQMPFTVVPNVDDLASSKCIVAIEIDYPVLSQIGSQEFEAVKFIILNAHSTIWITKGGGNMDCQSPESAMMVGLARSVRGELPELKLAILDLDPAPSSTSQAETIFKIAQAQDHEGNLEHEFLERGGALHVVRVIPDERLSKLLSTASRDVSAKFSQNEEVPTMQPLVQPGRPLKLELNKIGDLDSLVFRDDSATSRILGEDEVEIKVKAVGIDYYDMSIAVGQIWDPVLGCECSGIVTRLGGGVNGLAIGDRVTSFSLSPNWYKTFVRTTQNALHILPDHMSFEDGVGLIRSFGAVVYGLVHAGRLEKSDTVLIIDAATAIGQAAVQLARYIGAEVLAVVSTNAEKQMLIDSGIISEHIFGNMNDGYGQGIKRVTSGRGVDVVFNYSMTGEMQRQVWHCVAPFGRFIELGMKDIRSNTGLDMSPFASNATFTGVNMKCMFFSNRTLFVKVLAQTMSYLELGIIKPSPLHILKLSGISEGFRTLQSRSKLGRGRIVLQVDTEDIVPVLGERPKVELQLRHNATYIVPGGLGGLGRPLLRWMASRGARNIVTTSRSGIKSSKAQELVTDLEALGTRIEVFACDIGNESELRKILKQIAERGLPPIRGAIVCAMSVQDTFFETMTHADFQAALRPKYNVADNLHRLLPDQAEVLDFFVCVSSAAGQIGSIAQGNYNAGNTYQDALCRHRREVLGLPGTSVDLGWMRDIGFVAEAEIAKVPQIVRDGVRELDTNQFLAIMEAAISGEEESQPILGLATGALVECSRADSPYWFSDARFSMLGIYDTWQSRTSPLLSQRQDLGFPVDTKMALATAKTGEETTAIVLAGLTAKIARSLMVAPDELDQTRPLNTYGVDSLVAVDIRAWALKEMQAIVLVSEILKSQPMTKLAQTIAQASQLVSFKTNGA